MLHFIVNGIPSKPKAWAGVEFGCWCWPKRPEGDLLAALGISLSKVGWELLISLLKKLFILWPVKILPCTLYCQVPVSHLDDVFDAQLNCKILWFVFKVMIRTMLVKLKSAENKIYLSGKSRCVNFRYDLLMEGLVCFLSDISSEKNKSVLRMNIIKFNIIYCYDLMLFVLRTHWCELFFSCVFKLVWILRMGSSFLLPSLDA